MIVEEGGCLRIEGPITMHTVADILESGRSMCRKDGCEEDRLVDLSGVGPVDSAALALVLAWMRAAQEGGRKLRLIGVPHQLRSLAALYDLGDLLPLGGTAAETR